ncbi:MAG TPA: hypothetical protein VFY10_01605 [Dehalococcoidia bacterium]|nr:hypothetical protein [Dehalococcoidia bacterium]
MEDDFGFQSRRERLRRALRKIDALLVETNSALDVIASDALRGTKARHLDDLRGQLESELNDYFDESSAFLEYARERQHKIEEAKEKAAMAEKRKRPARDQERIQEVSDQLTRDLRLGRVDEAIKELLSFLSDTDFLAASASTGRRRRLRTLQNAIDKALQK